MSLTVYGLKNCDTCRKAITALDEGGHKPAFVDIRAEPSVAGLIPGWITAVGEAKIINRASMTWRKLSDAQQARADDPATLAALLDEHRTLIKRPVIVSGDSVHVGWTKDVKAAFGV
ncbi:MAG: glutaredoxin-dependent arsenate reducase ArsC [Oceanicaulis sp. HLUCCA04]|nr:MAG: glutaredoxin-dependent arsenate reducase ArsC [Oceanicaulis sp. HLUCCA04]